MLAALGARLFRQAYGVTHPEPALTPYLTRAFDPTQLTIELGTSDVTVFLATDHADRAIGYAYLRRSVHPWPDHLPGSRPAEILRFYVDQDAHGGGIGRALMEACEAETRAMGCDLLWASVWEEAHGPLTFYRRMGMQPTGPGIFQFGDRQDVDLIMARILD